MYRSVPSMGSLLSQSRSGIWCCHERWCRSQTWLGSAVAVAMAWAGSCSSDSAPLAWELPYAAGAAIKRKKIQKETPSKLYFQKLPPGRRDISSLVFM